MQDAGWDEPPDDCEIVRRLCLRYLDQRTVEIDQRFAYDQSTLSIRGQSCSNA